MTHYGVGVVIPKGDTPEGFIDEAMVPFDENTNVDEYDNKCNCAKNRAYYDADKKVSDVLGTVDEARKKFNDKYKDIKPDKANKLWVKEVIKPREELRESFVKDDPLKDVPDKTCTSCHGTGTYKSRYNPISKWDWYQVEGRWKGFLNKKNTMTVKNYLQCIRKNNKKMLYAYLINGQWYEKGKMLMFGMSDDRMTDYQFRKQMITVFSKVKASDTIVVVDCHI